MRSRIHHRNILALSTLVAGLLTAPGPATAQAKIYPAGTDCSNLATIAERLLCGRQEYRRQHGLSVDQPTSVPGGTVDEPNPIPTMPAPSELVLPPSQGHGMQAQPNTASPNH